MKRVRNFTILTMVFDALTIFLVYFGGVCWLRFFFVGEDAILSEEKIETMVRFFSGNGHEYDGLDAWSYVPGIIFVVFIMLMFVVVGIVYILKTINNAKILVMINKKKYDRLRKLTVFSIIADIFMSSYISLGFDISRKIMISRKGDFNADSV